MVQGILKTLGTSIRGLHQAAYLLAAFTLASQLLALARDRIFAGVFGAGPDLDLYYAAFKIPDLVFALVASAVSAYVLIPRIAAAGREETRALLSQAVSLVVMAGGLISLVLFAFAGPALSALFPSIMAASGDEFVLVTRILLLQPILLGISGIVGSVTQVKRRFVLYSLSPVVYNAGIILGALFLYPVFGLAGVAWGVIAGAVLHLSMHLPVLLEAKVIPRPVAPSWRALWPVARDSLPRSFALALGAVTTLALTAIAAVSGEGGIAVFTLAMNLEGVPLALIGASYATAAFPVLAEEAGVGKGDAFRATLTAAARHLIFWSSVAAVLVIVLRAHIVRVLLGSGAFDWNDTRLTAAMLGILVIGLVAQGIVLLASRAFYAANRSWNPLVLQAVGLMVSLGAALGGLALAHSSPLMRYFVEAMLRVEDVPGSSVLFVALGATVGQLVMGALALVTLRAVAPGVARSLLRPALEGVAAAVIGGAAAYGALTFMGNIAPLTTLFAVLAQGVVAGMVGLIAAASVLILLENKEFRDVYESLRRITSSKALPPLSEI